MSKTNLLVTYKQAILLKNLGFNSPTSHYCIENLEQKRMRGRQYNCLIEGRSEKWNCIEARSTLTKEYSFPYIAIPTVFDAIRWLDVKTKKIQHNVETVLYMKQQAYVCDTPKKLRSVVDFLIETLIVTRESVAKVNNKKNKDHDK
nr:MAG TPA: hypothetical protein [Caudoviricetes sp.]